MICHWTLRVYTVRLQEIIHAQEHVQTREQLAKYQEKLVLLGVQASIWDDENMYKNDNFVLIHGSKTYG